MTFRVRAACVSSFVLVAAVACGSSGSGGTAGGKGDAGPGAGGGGSSSTLPSCAAVCPAVVARSCPKGPVSQADCTAGCEQLRGACADRYNALYTCGGATPKYSCDPQGYITMTGCEAQYAALTACPSAGGG
jgi:hypothetical protein